MACGIFGNDGTAWCAENSKMTKAEALEIIKNTKDNSPLMGTGFSVGGERFAAIRVNSEGLLVGKGKACATYKKGGFCMQKFAKGIVWGICKKVTMKLSWLLVSLWVSIL